MTLPAYTGTLAPAHGQLIADLGDQWAATVLSTDPVIEAVGGGHEHRLFAGTPGTALFSPAGGRGQDIGLLQCTEAAYVAHPEHAYAGIAPGTYALRRQREQADEERFAGRLVAD